MSLFTVGEEANCVALEMVKLMRERSLNYELKICHFPPMGRCWTLDDDQYEQIQTQIRGHLEDTSMPYFNLFLFSCTDGLPSAIIDVLEDYSRHLQLFSYYITLKPKGNGQGVMDEVLTYQYILNSSEYFGVRYLQEAISFLERREHKEIQLSQVYRLIASDLLLLFTTFHPSSRGELIQLPSSTYSKCFDFRSSLWRSITPQVKTHASSDCNFRNSKLRDVAVNLHTLHLSSGLSLKDTLSMSELVTFALKEGKVVRSTALSEACMKEGKTSINWAAPGLQCSTFDNNFRSLRVSSSMNEIAGRNVWEVGLLFASPYVKDDLRQSTRSVRGMASSGAFLHLYKKHNISFDDILDAANAVDFYLNDF